MAPGLSGAPEAFHSVSDPAGVPLRVGLLDGPIPHGIPALRAADVTTLDLAPRGTTAHGAVAAAVLVGVHGCWTGVAPGVRLFAAGVLGVGRRGRVADAVLDGLCWLLEREVEIVLMPFGRPSSEPRLARLLDQVPDTVEVRAAAGNSASGSLLFPARHPRVTAVGAFQPDGRPWPGASVDARVRALAPDRAWALGTTSSTGPPAFLHGTSASCLLSLRDRVPHQRRPEQERRDD